MEIERPNKDIFLQLTGTNGFVLDFYEKKIQPKGGEELVSYLKTLCSHMKFREHAKLVFFEEERLFTKGKVIATVPEYDLEDHGIDFVLNLEYFWLCMVSNRFEQVTKVDMLKEENRLESFKF